MELKTYEKECIKNGIEYLEKHDWCKLNLFEGPIKENPDNCKFCALGAIAMANGYNPNKFKGADIDDDMYDFIKHELGMRFSYQKIYSLNDTSRDKKEAIERLKFLVED